MTTAAPVIAAPIAPRPESASMKFYRRLFSDVPERSVRVRIVALMASLWAAGTLVLVGASFAIPLLSMPFFVVGHVVAYRAIRKRVPALPVVIALIIIVVGVSMRHELVLAVRGERIPVAHFLLIAGAASVFEARTRAGLYTQLFFSALIMFFASELAFGNEFAALLGGYLAIIVSFLALTQYTDITRSASVARRGGLPGAFAFWGGVTAMVGVSSLVAFLLLPWDASQTPEAARFAILPVNGSGEGTEAPVSPEEAREFLDRAAQQLANSGDAGGLSGDLASGNLTGDLSGLGGLSGGTAIIGGGATGSSGQFETRPRGDALSAPELDPGSVAYIRSAVASYWRGSVYDSFDSPAGGGEGDWVSTLPDGRRLGSLFGRPDADGDDQRYLQTFFMQQGLGNAFVTGYEPFSIGIPRDERGMPSAEEGVTYQVVSGRPAITPDELREDEGGWAATEYGVLPPGYADIYALARAMTAGAETDFDRAATIAAYLNSLEYAPDAESPLDSTGDLSEFVFGERPGTAIDFATAQALMSRAVGLQSRVATGFLPGSFNPYSGAAEITGDDLHAWAEVLFRDAGWVPFDASSRPNLPNPDSVESPPPGGFSSLLDRRLGDNLASALNSSPGALAVVFEWLLKSGPLFGAFVMLLTAVAGFAYWFYWFRRRQRAELSEWESLNYSNLSGPDRAYRLRILKAFGKLERRLAKAGFRRRRPSEPINVFAQRAAGYMTRGSDGIMAAALAADRAAYSPASIGPDSAGEIESLVRRIDLRSATVDG